MRILVLMLLRGMTWFLHAVGALVTGIATASASQHQLLLSALAGMISGAVLHGFSSAWLLFSECVSRKHQTQV